LLEFKDRSNVSWRKFTKLQKDNWLIPQQSILFVENIDKVL